MLPEALGFPRLAVQIAVRGFIPLCCHARTLVVNIHRWSPASWFKDSLCFILRWRTFTSKEIDSIWFDQILRKKKIESDKWFAHLFSFSVWSNVTCGICRFFLGGGGSNRPQVSPVRWGSRVPIKRKISGTCKQISPMQAECKAYIFMKASLYNSLCSNAQVCFPHVSTILLEIRGLHFWGNLSIVQRYDRYACDQFHNNTFVTDPLVAWTKGVLWIGQWQVVGCGTKMSEIGGHWGCSYITDEQM